MKIRKMLPFALCTIFVATAQAAPNAAKAPSALTQGHFTGSKVTVMRAERDVFLGAERIASKGDTLRTVEGTRKNPLRLESPTLQLSAQRATMVGSNIYFSGGQGAKARLKFTLKPHAGKSPVKVEAECFVGTIAEGKITLEDSVSGFYQDSTGRHALGGGIVTLSTFDNAISIVQDGAITLSASP